MYGWVRSRYIASERRRNFLRRPWAGGLVLLAGVAVAMLLANLPWTARLYEEVLGTELALRIGRWEFPAGMTVETFINDSLMVIFFFTVGLEIKREVSCGALSSVKKALLPVFCALGGMLMPALIFTLFNHGTPAAGGWGIPTATDIAFAIGIMSILGDRVPASLKVFLTALAVADDLGAIIVIALFYGGHINLVYFALACVVLAIVYLFNRLGEKRIMFYLVPAIVVWGLFYYSGVHATMAGVLMALMIPLEPRYSKEYFLHKAVTLEHSLYKVDNRGEDFPNSEHRYYLRRINRLASQSVGMSYRLEHFLTPYVTFLIMPVFAAANAGVEIPSAEYCNIFHTSPQTGAVGMGIFFGLLVGKPLGIFLAGWAAVRLGLGERPQGASWKMFFAVACLGGIGFTMSIFVNMLAFDNSEIIDMGKIAILFGSTAAAVVGTCLVLLVNKIETKGKTA